MPSVRTLARDCKVSVMTVKNAYANLMNMNLIRSQQSKGYFVLELSAEEKKELAIKTFRRDVQSVVKTAISESLTSEEILRVVEEVISKEERDE